MHRTTLNKCTSLVCLVNVTSESSYIVLGRGMVCGCGDELRTGHKLGVSSSAKMRDAESASTYFCICILGCGTLRFTLHCPLYHDSACTIGLGWLGPRTALVISGYNHECAGGRVMGQRVHSHYFVWLVWVCRLGRVCGANLCSPRCTQLHPQLR